MNAPVMLPKGTNLTRLAIALASSRKDAISARDIAESRWGVASPVAQILRSAVSSGSIGDPVWAGALAPYQVIASEFVEALRPLTILGRMAGMRRLPLNVRVPRAETAKQAEAFKVLEDRAAAAAAALAQAKIDNQISFGKQTALLSESDASIAQRLTAKFGSDVPAAMASSEAAALRLNDALHQISSSIDSDLTSGLADIVSGTKSVSDGFTAMAASILRDIEKIVIQTAIVQPLMRGISSAFGGVAGFNPFSGLTGHADGGLIAGPGGPRSDNILARLSPGEYVVNADATARNRDLLDAINSGMPGFASGGYVGMPSLPSPVARQSAESSISVSVINNTGVKVQAQQVIDGRGNRGVQLTLDDAVAASLSRPGSATRGAMRNNFGASPVRVRR